MNIVKPTFWKSFFEMISGHTQKKTNARRFQNPPVCERFRKAPFSRRISVDGTPGGGKA